MAHHIIFDAKQGFSHVRKCLHSQKEVQDAEFYV